MQSARYIEVDDASWSETPHTPRDLAALFEALADDGWETAGTGRRRRLFVRRFGSGSEYRASLATARFKVAAYLVGPEATGC
jgi:hypothetical protein